MEKILIVDDDKVVTQLLSININSLLNIECVIAHSLAETKAIIESGGHRFHMAVLDYNLPDAEDGEVIDYVQSMQIPSIVLTANYDTGVRDTVLSKKVIDYILKKNTAAVSTLVATINRIVNNKNIKALVVDDSSVYRTMLKGILETQMLKVYAGNNGVEAMEIIKHHPDIRLVITDYEMPEMDGLDLLTNIRKTYSKNQMAVIVASGVSGSLVVPKFLKQGANDYVTKPCNAEELICRVNLHLDNYETIHKLEDLATKDILTSLHNRRYFYDAVRSLHASAKRKKFNMAVLMIDLDNFKNINDTFGHAAGDDVLKKAASILRQDFSRTSDVLARIGGEEFCAVVPYENQRDLYAFVENIRITLGQQTVVYNDALIQFTVSIGICAELMDKLDDMIKKADDMLYIAKNTGRNKTCIYPEMT